MQVDLRRLPSWLQWALALAIVAAVVTLAWFVGGDQPVPAWASDQLVPALGVAWLVLLAIGLVSRFVTRRRALSRRGDPGTPVETEEQR